MGKTWTQYDLKEFGPRSGCRINKKNTDGWFRMDLRKGWIERAEVLFLKPKPPRKKLPLPECHSGQYRHRAFLRPMALKQRAPARIDVRAANMDIASSKI